MSRETVSVDINRHNIFKVIAGTIIALTVIFIVIYAASTTEGNPIKQINKTESKILFKTDSSGCKIYLIEHEGKKYLVNNQGGLVEVKEETSESKKN